MINWRNKLTGLASLLAIGIVLAACRPAGDNGAAAGGRAVGFATYQYPGGLFTLGLPSDWVVNDTSDSGAVNVEFSPPDSPRAQLAVFIINRGEFEGEFDASVDQFVRLFYADQRAPYKEVARDLQPDGSVRLSGAVQSPGLSTQHNDFLMQRGPYFVALRSILPSDPTSLRTLNRIVNTFELHQEAPWQRAVQGLEAAVRQGAVSFSGLNAWTDNSNNFIVAGQILNNVASPLEFVRISALLYDASNNLLLEKGDFIAADVVQPGEFSPFKVLFPDGLPAGTVRYELHASARYADFAAETFYGATNFNVIDKADFDSNGLLVVSGQVTNNGGQRASLVKVIVTVFDAERRVVATNTTLVEAQSLTPGETSTFRVQFADLGGAADTYLSIAQASVIP